MMSCEQTPRVSDLLDGELAPLDTAVLVEHLLRCPACATFFRRGRALDAALLLAAAAPADGVGAPPPPEAVWERIVAGSGVGVSRPAAHRPPRRRPLPGWALPFAAMALLALGAVFGWQASSSTRVEGGASAAAPSPAAGSAGSITALAAQPDRRQRSGTMDEQRFVAIARELLAAEPRYRDAMVGVLAVARGEQRREGSTAESAWREEEMRELRAERPRS